MIYTVCAIYDAKAQAFAPPGFFQAKGIAIRAYMEAIANKQGNLGKYPLDFQLHMLGTWDDQNGQMTNVDKPTVLAIGDVTPKETP